MIQLTAEDHNALKQDGFLIVNEVVPEELCRDVVTVIQTFLTTDSDSDPKGWYEKNLGRNGIVPIHQHQALWNIRQYPAVHSLFAQLFGTEKLWVRLDRLSFKPPVREVTGEASLNNYVHVDFPPAKLKSLRLQGVLYLTDTAEDQGAFCCVPSLFREREQWQNKTSLVFSPEELAGHDIVNIPGKAGTMIIWDSGLPHSGAQNVSDRPRMAQYLSMFPEDTEEDRETRIALWQNRQAPERWRGLPYQQDPEPGEPAELTELGQKLLGANPW